MVVERETTSALDADRLAEQPLGRLIPAAFAVWLLLAVLALATLIGLLFYAWPYSDDYTRAALSMTWYQVPGIREGTRPGTAANWSEYVKLTYLYWQGRWATTGLAAGVLSNIALNDSYAWPLVGYTVVQAIALAALWRVLLGPIGWLRLVVVVLGTQLLLWTGMPAPSESLYWYTGVFENQLPIFLAVIVVAAMAGLSRATPRLRRGLLPLVCALCVVITGMHEQTALGLTVVLALGTLLAYRQGDESWRSWLVLLVVTCLGTGVSMLAPGNAIRAAEVRRDAARLGMEYPDRLADRLRLALKAVLSQQRHHLLLWPVDPRLLAATALLVLSPGLGRVASILPARIPKTWRLAALGAWALLLALWCGAPAIVYCGWIPGRSLGGTYTIFLLGWIVNVVFWTPAAPTEPQPEPARDPRVDLVRLIAFAVFSLSILVQGNFRTAVQDLKNRRVQGFQQGRRAWEAAIATAKQRGEQDVVVEDLPAKPTLFGDKILLESPKATQNGPMATYFGLRSIRVDRLRESRKDEDSPDGPAADPAKAETGDRARRYD